MAATTMFQSFSDDPYAIKTPLAAQTHYMQGSGGALNLYAHDIDVSSLSPEKFDDIQKILDSGKAGSFPIQDALGQFDTDAHAFPSNVTPSLAVGRVTPIANGTLTTDGKGSYQFAGWLGFHDDYFNFDERPGRTPLAEASTVLGRMTNGKDFFIYIVGTQPFVRSGRR